MHELFEWDDATAANEHRLQQARQVVRSLLVVEESNDGTIGRPAFYHVNYQSDNGKRQVQGYQSIKVVAERPAAKTSAAVYLLSQLEGLQRRYSALGDLFEPVWAEVARIRSELGEDEKAA